MVEMIQGTATGRGDRPADDIATLRSNLDLITLPKTQLHQAFLGHRSGFQPRSSFPIGFAVWLVQELFTITESIANCLSQLNVSMMYRVECDYKIDDYGELNNDDCWYTILELVPSHDIINIAVPSLMLSLMTPNLHS